MALLPLSFSRYTAARVLETVVDDDDWSALQEVPGDVDLIDTAGASWVMMVAIARDELGEVVSGTCTLQVVEVSQTEGGTALVVGSAADEAVPYGSAVTLELYGARYIAVRIEAATGNPDIITIYARGVQ